jgi:preprotein translocase subunit SecE
LRLEGKPTAPELTKNASHFWFWSFAKQNSTRRNVVGFEGFLQYFGDKEGGMNKLVQFIKESYAELRKVVWPGREDVVSSVKVVIVSTILFAAILGLVDVLLLLGVRAIF